ncbi:MAG: hypothetical protein ACRBBP_08525 [Bdellovibrionales bacterium]
MKIIILRQNMSNFLKEASSAETTAPNGEWRYFKFKSEDEVLGLYENNTEGIEAHPDFFKYFLGQFSPKTTQTVSVNQSKNFEDFCLSLNSILNEGHEILDLSYSNYWIWTNQKSGSRVPKKLQDFLSFNS